MTGVGTRARPEGAAPAAPAHPRIRARRVEVARDLGRRRRRRLNGVLALVCAVVWALVGLRSPILDVDRVQVTGAERTAASEVRAALGSGPGRPMVDVDPGAAAARVATLPWVDEARVQRLWPGTVRVVVVERQPAAAAPHPEGWATIDREGRILAVGPTRPTGLVALAERQAGRPGEAVTGPDRALLRVAGSLPPPLREDVVTIRGGPDGVVVDLDGGTCVVLGDGRQLEAKARAAAAVRADADLAGEGRIDVRVPSAPALTRDAPCA